MGPPAHNLSGCSIRWGSGFCAVPLGPLAKLARDVLQDSATMPATYLEVLDYFHFWPSRDLAIVALSLFLFASLTVLAMTIYTRSWCAVHYITSIQDLHPPAERKRKLWLKVTCTCRYMVIVTIVGLMEMGGYACRISMFDKTQYGVYVAMQCLLIIPPSFLALVQARHLPPSLALFSEVLHITTSSLQPCVVGLQ